VDFARLFEEDNYADFATLWLLLHATRTAPREGSLEKSWLETWRAKGLDEGERIVEKLRFSVADALRQLGTGFVAHPKNTMLRQKLNSGELTTDAYFQQVLRLVYRMLFLLTAEDRNIALFPGAEYKAARSLYDKGYSINNLRERARFKRNHDYYGDAWQQLLINFSGFAVGQPELAQPALGGLFAENQCPDIDTCELQNRYFYAALYKLCYFEQGQSLARINYRDMNTEEFGSVYEALLELTPQLHTQGQWSFSFQGDAEGEQTASGNARKLSGAYYTPDSLVQELIKSALVPVIEDRLKGKANQADKRDAILSITVCDPACGSGHFLLGAARRLAAELAQIDADKDQPTDRHYRHALRDIVINCIYGVDINLLAVELCRVGLWLESIEPGLPLGFLDSHIQCGNSLLFTKKNLINDGVPEGFMTLLIGDNKDIYDLQSQTFKSELRGQSDLFSESSNSLFEIKDVINEFKSIDEMSDNSLLEVNSKSNSYYHALSSDIYKKISDIYDLYLAAFVWPRDTVTPPLSPFRIKSILSESAELSGAEKEVLENICNEYKFFHWEIRYPKIFNQGGFDVVLGNPPWERANLKFKEFFSSRLPHLLSCENKEQQEDAINSLMKSGAPEYKSYAREKRKIDGTIHIIRSAKSFELTNNGFINYYSSFAELGDKLISLAGRLGMILQSGIATDESNKGFFDYLINDKKLISVFDFINSEKLFDIDSRMKFTLLTTGSSCDTQPKFAFYLTNTRQILLRGYEISIEDLLKLNPNTKTCTTFRMRKDADLALQIYKNSCHLSLDSTVNDFNGKVELHRMFNATTDRPYFKNLYNSESFELSELLPVYESKLIWQFDHRFATFDSVSKSDQIKGNARELSSVEKTSSEEILPRFFTDKGRVHEFNAKYGWRYDWYLGIRMVASPTNERTCILSMIPMSGSVNSLNLFTNINVQESAVLLASLNSLLVDFVARSKVGNLNVNQWIVRQLPTIAFDKYSTQELSFICCRVLELVYTSYSLKAWALDLGYENSPFNFDDERRAVIRAELDAFYMHKHKLAREDVLYILNPISVMGSDCPSTTFPGLMANEIREFGEYRTQRLVLREFDRMTLAEANCEEYTSLLVPPPGQQADPTYASVGVFRDHEDAQLAGLIWAAIATGNASQAEIRGLLTLLTLQQALHIYLLPESQATAKQLFNKYQPLFTQERINHADTIISHFKRQAWVRTDSKGIFTVSAHGVPDGIQVNGELTTLAEHLLVAAKASLQSDKQQTGADTETSTKSA